jgi:hypothetical protein
MTGRGAGQPQGGAQVPSVGAAAEGGVGEEDEELDEAPVPWGVEAVEVVYRDDGKSEVLWAG